MTKAADLSALGSNVTTAGNLSSASTLTLQTNSTTALTIDTSQNVGIGTSSPATKLQVSGASGSLNTRINAGNTGLDITPNDATGVTDLATTPLGGGGKVMTFTTYTGSASAERMRIDSSGNVGIGTTGPGSKLQVTGANVGTTAGDKSNLLSLVTSSGNSDLFIFEDRRVANGSSHNTTMNFIYRKIDATNMGYIGFGSSGTAYPPLSFGNDTTEYMRILSSGDMLLGQTAYTTPPTQTNDFFSGGLIINPTRRTTGSGANCFWNAADGVFSRSTSSLKYKTDVQDAIHGLSDVLKLRPITYKGKSESDEGKVFGGFLAEEVDEVGLKEFVEYDVDNKPDSLAYGNMVSLLTKAIQEQQTIINDLKADIVELKTKVDK